MKAIQKKDAKAAQSAMADHMADCECHVIEMEAVVANRFLKRDTAPR
jgi:DNA-binding FadR family transcriptional regulator